MAYRARQGRHPELNHWSFWALSELPDYKRVDYTMEHFRQWIKEEDLLPSLGEPPPAHLFRRELATRLSSREDG